MLCVSLLSMLSQALQVCAQCCVSLQSPVVQKHTFSPEKDPTARGAFRNAAATIELKRACPQLKWHFDVQVATFDLLATLPEHALPMFSVPAIDDV